MRFYLFQKKCYEHFASVKGIRLSDEIREYTSAEKACLAHLLYPSPLSQRLAPGKEASQIWQMQTEVERNEMAPHVRRIREVIKHAARHPIADDSDSELKLDSSDEERENARTDLLRKQKAAIIDSGSEVEELLSSSEEMVPYLNSLRISQEISISEEGMEEDSFLESGEDKDIDLSDEDTFSLSESFSEFNK